MSQTAASRPPGSELASQNGSAAPVIRIRGARTHNLQNVDLNVPLGTLTCVTGVSGSGKSSLIMNTLAPAVARRLNLTTEAPGPHRELTGIEHLSKIVVVDQNPIGNLWVFCCEYAQLSLLSGSHCSDDKQAGWTGLRDFLKR